GFPKLRGDDLQLGHVPRLPLLRRVRPTDPLTGVGVLEHVDPVPHELAGVDAVEKDAVTSRGIPVDGRGVPLRAAWRRNTFLVQVVGDLPGGLPGDVRLEDAANDLRLLLDDNQLAPVGGVGTVTVGSATSRQTLMDEAGHATPDL